MSIDHAIHKLRWSVESVGATDGSHGWSAMLSPDECEELLDFIEKARELIWQLKLHVESTAGDDSFQFSSFSEFLSAPDADSEFGTT